MNIFYKYIVLFIIIVALFLIIWGLIIDNKSLRIEKQSCENAVANAQELVKKANEDNIKRQVIYDKEVKQIEYNYKKKLEKIDKEYSGNTCEESINYLIKKGQEFK